VLLGRSDRDEDDGRSNAICGNRIIEECSDVLPRRIAQSHPDIMPDTDPFPVTSACAVSSLVVQRSAAGCAETA
jgi:hypothetical protein